MPRTVQLSEDAYASLAALKKDGESFSHVVKRLVRARRDPHVLLELGGVRDDFDVEDLRRLSMDRDLARLRELGLLHPKESRRRARRKG